VYTKEGQDINIFRYANLRLTPSTSTSWQRIGGSYRHVEGGCFGGLGLAESREGAVVVALGPRHSEQVLVAGGSIMWEARGGPDFWPSGQWAAPTVLQSAEVSNLPRPPFCMLPSDSHRSFKHLIGEHALVNQMLNADAQILMPMKVPSMFERREGAVGALLPGGECVIVAGGARFCPGDPMGLDPEPYASKTVEVYDIASNSWAYGPPMHFERYGAAGCVLQDGRFLVVGGRSCLFSSGVSGSGEVVGTAEFFYNGKWTILGNAPRIVHGELVPVVGGCVLTGGVKAQVHQEVGLHDSQLTNLVHWQNDELEPRGFIYDDDNDRWRRLPFTMNAPRTAAAAVVIDYCKDQLNELHHQTTQYNVLNS
jgi:hypothetical protein